MVDLSWWSGRAEMISSSKVNLWRTRSIMRLGQKVWRTKGRRHVLRQKQSSGPDTDFHQPERDTAE